MKILEQTTKSYKNSNKWSSLADLSEQVLINYNILKKTLPVLPMRVIHGDLKLNNPLFYVKSGKAVDLVDLDTLGRNNITIDLVDVIQSWCVLYTPKEPNFSYSFLNAFVKSLSTISLSS